MRVRVLFFGQLREIVGLAQEEVDLSPGASVEDLFARYGGRFPRLAGFRPSVVASINQEFADWTSALSSGDEVGFLPPVSGGEVAPGSSAQGSLLAGDVYRFYREPIPMTGLIQFVKTPEDGAVATFDGIVRNHSRMRNAAGEFSRRETLHLEYQAYEPMALGKMREIGAEAHRRFPIHRLAMVHRLGRLEIGETSVFIAVSAAHRAAALNACRFAIDTLKRVVPIWKKEFSADGAVWAEGQVPTVKPLPPSSESKP